MRLFLPLLILALVSSLQAQDTQADSLDRKGSVWLDGSADLNATTDQLRAGYFFTDRLLVGGGLAIIGNDDTYVSPFARYYLTGSDRKWRPYGEAGLQLGVRNFSIEENHFALGVERAFNSTTLLNLELRYTNQRGRSDSYGTRGRLNTVLGGVAWKKAARQHFQAGSFVVGNQLFDASITTSNAFSFNYVNISPSVDYFLTDRLAVQASIDVTLSAFNQKAAPSNLDYQALYANLRGGARYYLTTKSLFNLFAEGGFTYQSRYIDREAVFGDDGNSSHSLRADLGLGASVFINKNTSIDFGVNLNQDVLGGSDTFADGFLRLKFWFD